MLDAENNGPPTGENRGKRADPPPEATGDRPRFESPGDFVSEKGDRHLATPEVAADAEAPLGASPLFPMGEGQDEPKLRGPEIPNAEVDERGIFRFVNGDDEVYESPRIEASLAPLVEEERAIEWLWPGRVALGMVTFLEGAGSAGKSFVVLDMAARVTRGAPWPGRVEGPQPAGDVLLLCGDSDGWERALLPRLTEAGANLLRITRAGTVNSHDPSISDRKRSCTERRFAFPHDLVMLEYLIRVNPQTRLVVIDSLSAFCADRRAGCETLRQLDEIAARRNVAIVVTDRPTSRAARRPNESDRRADTARAVFRVVVDLEDETLHHLAPVRMTLWTLPEWLPFRIVPGCAIPDCRIADGAIADGAIADGAIADGAGRGVVAWGVAAEEVPESAVPPNPARERGALRRMVKEWLRVMLMKSDMPCTTVVAEAQRCGYSEATLRRARAELGVRMYRDSAGPFSSGWWTLRPPETPVAETVDYSAIESWEPRPMVREQFVPPILEAVLENGFPNAEPRQAACNGHALSNGDHESNGRLETQSGRPPPY
jgi:putative DNA primase/helicase